MLGLALIPIESCLEGEGGVNSQNLQFTPFKTQLAT
jgi:hypothetical protein